MDHLPPFYDDLDASLAEAWRLWGVGVRDRRSPFHTPALATIDPQRRPQVRAVVLRAADAGQGLLRFHCDRRSEKAVDLVAAPVAALQGYDPVAKVQLRAEGVARVHTDDALADAAWAEARPMSRVCYGIDPGPGTPLARGDAYTLPAEAGAEGEALGRENFAAVVVRVERLEFLYLDRRGHRRALWRRGMGAEGVFAGGWLAP